MEKKVLTSCEVADMLGITQGYLYKLTSKKLIPFYKPMGKIILFDKDEVEAWAFRNRVATDEELEMKAKSYCNKK